MDAFARAMALRYSPKKKHNLQTQCTNLDIYAKAITTRCPAKPVLQVNRMFHAPGMFDPSAEAITKREAKSPGDGCVVW